MVFSVELFKKGLKKAFFIPTFIMLGLAILFHLMLGNFLPHGFLGKELIALTGFYGAFFLSIFSLRCQLLKKKFIKECWNFPFSVPVLSAFISSIGLFVVSAFLFYLKWLPLLGSILALLICGAQFVVKMAIFILAPLMLFSLYLAGMSLQKEEKFTMKGHLKEIVMAIQDPFILKKFLKASLPLFFFSLVALFVQHDILLQETSPLKGLMQIILTVVMSLSITPWINYFILASFIRVSSSQTEFNRHQVSVSK